MTDPNEDARFDYVKLLLQLGREDDAKIGVCPRDRQAAMSRRLVPSRSGWMLLIL